MLNEDVKKRIEPFTDVPVLFISVLEKQRILKTMEMSQNVYLIFSHRFLQDCG